MACKRKPKIVERKLGREGNWGQHWPDTNLIEIDPRLPSKRYLKIAIHELLHAYFPNASETQITRAAAKIANYLWDLRYRRIMK